MSNATERAYLYVREQILSGRYPAASHLKEEHIAEEAQDINLIPWIAIPPKLILGL